jgi:hypothetical protein
MIGWLEWLGYAASLIVLVSLLMSSVKKLRWINLAGSLLFATYGFLIGSLPVGLMNTGIVIINLYYLFQMYKRLDYFQLMSTVEKDYFNYFVSFHKENMTKFFELDDQIDHVNNLKVFILRNTIPAGILIGRTFDQDTLEILVDYATPQFRDFKMAKFLFCEKMSYFTDKGYKKLVTKPGNEKHQSYLKKIGFVKMNNDFYMKELIN